MNLNSSIRDIILQIAHDIVQNTRLSDQANDYTLYKGFSGQALFTLEAFLFFKHRKFLNYAEDTATKVMSIPVSQHTSLAFLTGLTGNLYLAIRLFKTTKDPKYLNYALSVARYLKEKQTYFENNAEYLHGISGILWALSDLHAQTRLNWLIGIIYDYLDQLISQVRLAKSGIYWDRGGADKHPLCGFSHGVSGIAYVLLELESYFGLCSLGWLAQQALDYENSQKEFLNNQDWPDWRSGIFVPKLQNQFISQFSFGNEILFEEPNICQTWCHGAPGIGLTRLKIYNKTNRYAEDLRICLQICKKTLFENHFDSLSLCHGVAGNCELLFQYALKANNTKLIKEIGQVISNTISKDCNHTDRSLFLGSSGWGLFLLQFLSKGKAKSILMPEIRTKSRLVNSVPLQKLLNDYKLKTIKTRLLFDYHFSRTGWMLKKMNRFKTLKVGQCASTKKLVSSLNFHIKEIHSNITNYRGQLMEIYSLEKKKLKMFNSSSSDIWFSAERIFSTQIKDLILQSEIVPFHRYYFTLPRGSQFYTCKWNWHELIKNTSIKIDVQSPYKLLLIPTDKTIHEIWLKDSLIIQILESTRARTHLGKMDYIESSKNPDKNILLNSYIKKLILVGMLIPHPIMNKQFAT